MISKYLKGKKEEEEEKTGNEIWIALPTNAENKI